MDSAQQEQLEEQEQRVETAEQHNQAHNNDNSNSNNNHDTQPEPSPSKSQSQSQQQSERPTSSDELSVNNNNKHESVVSIPASASFKTAHSSSSSLSGNASTYRASIASVASASAPGDINTNKRDTMARITETDEPPPPPAQAMATAVANGQSSTRPHSAGPDAATTTTTAAQGSSTQKQVYNDDDNDPAIAASLDTPANTNDPSRGGEPLPSSLTGEQSSATGLASEEPAASTTTNAPWPSVTSASPTGSRRSSKARPVSSSTSASSSYKKQNQNSGSSPRPLVSSSSLPLLDLAQAEKEYSQMRISASPVSMPTDSPGLAFPSEALPPPSSTLTTQRGSPDLQGGIVQSSHTRSQVKERSSPRTSQSSTKSRQQRASPKHSDGAIRQSSRGGSYSSLNAQQQQQRQRLDPDDFNALPPGAATFTSSSSPLLPPRQQHQQQHQQSYSPLHPAPIQAPFEHGLNNNIYNNRNSAPLLSTPENGGYAVEQLNYISSSPMQYFDTGFGSSSPYPPIASSSSNAFSPQLAAAAPQRYSMPASHPSPSSFYSSPPQATFASSSSFQSNSIATPSVRPKSTMAYSAGPGKQGKSLPEMRPSALEARPSASAPFPPSDSPPRASSTSAYKKKLAEGNAAGIGATGREGQVLNLAKIAAPATVQQRERPDVSRPLGQEICLECLMRDRDMADIEVTGPGIWSRASDIDFEEAVRAEETAIQQAAAAVHAWHAQAAGNTNTTSSNEDGLTTYHNVGSSSPLNGINGNSSTDENYFVPGSIGSNGQPRYLKSPSRESSLHSDGYPSNQNRSGLLRVY